MTPALKQRVSAFLEAREKATKGEWSHTIGKIFCYHPKGLMNVCDIRGWGFLTGVGGLKLSVEDAGNAQDANAAFIITAANDAPDLIRDLAQEVERLSAELVLAIATSRHNAELASSLRRDLQIKSEQYHDTRLEVERLTAEVQHLKDREQLMHDLGTGYAQPKLENRVLREQIAALTAQLAEMTANRDECAAVFAVDRAHEQEYRVVTADITVWAESPEDAINIARHDTGGRVHAEETGLTREADDSD